MPTVSLTMIVKNEEKYLARCLQSVVNLVDEMIVVDTGSTDKTKFIAEQFGAKVYDYHWDNHFANARNFALQKANSDWNLVLDADEYLVGDTEKSLRSFIETKRAIGRVLIVSKYLDNGEVKYSRQLASRLFPKGAYYKGRIHEQIISDLPHFVTTIELHHSGYYETDKTDRNLPLLLLESEDQPDNPYILYHIAINEKNRKNYSAADQYYEKAYSLLTGKEGYAPVLVVDYLYNIMVNGNLDKGITIIDKEKKRLSHFPDFHFVKGLFFMDYVQKDLENRLHMIDWIEESYLTCIELGESNHNDSVVGVGSFLAAYNLGVLYELFGIIDKAEHYYREASNFGYQPAAERLNQLLM
ncbi:glycosyltransferase [Bacillus thuringiensis]|nr:glycosyltransferase [Bacillus thuringiensis]